MGLMYDKKPTKSRESMDNRSWHLDLSRRFNGAMCILRDTDYSRGYDNEMWGAGYAMTYTIPRKTLRMTGDASWPILRKISPPDASDELLLEYCRHPDFNVWQMTARVIRNQKRDHLMPVLLKESDPRVRHAGVMTI